ncbi:MAG TPA: M64 family metallopeptidase [Streptomyces sp.]|nr:M64 family metallopeptidase [Streptomyces sp.]
MRNARLGAGAGAIAAALLLLVTPGSATAQQPAAPPTQSVEYFTGPHGHPHHTNVPVATPERLARDNGPALAGDGDVTQIVHNGPSADTLDVVVIGDGYTAGQLAQFHTDAKEKWHEITGVEPWTTYQNLFNVWAVDAVSAESGVSGDPDPSVVRDTALDSSFWCDGIERLLCVDTSAVDRYAALAPEADLVIVVANTSKYGGAGYNQVSSPLGYDGIATVAGGNEQSAQIVVHETGHSLGKLADEYAYQERTYTGPEPGEANISTHPAADMQQRGVKWARWLGEPTPDGGVIGTFEGAAYYTGGLYRPSQDSLMRSLNHQGYNLVGREAMIGGFYRHASLLTSDVPTAGVLPRHGKVSVDVPHLTGAAAPVTVRWYLDGRELTGLRGDHTVNVAPLLRHTSFGVHDLTAKAADPTDAVRDPSIRAELTDTLTWHIHR